MGDCKRGRLCLSIRALSSPDLAHNQTDRAPCDFFDKREYLTICYPFRSGSKVLGRSSMQEVSAWSMCPLDTSHTNNLAEMTCFLPGTSWRAKNILECDEIALCPDILQKLSLCQGIGLTLAPCLSFYPQQLMNTQCPVMGCPLT